MRVSFWAGNQYFVINLDLVRRIFSEEIEGADFPYKMAFVYSDRDIQKIGFKEEKLRDKYVSKIEDLWNSIDLEAELKKPEPEVLEQELKDYDPMEAIK